MRYGFASARLREAVASSTRRHASEVVPWSNMRTFLACRGLTINKRPRVRPIGVGRCCQPIEAKVMASATWVAVLDVLWH